VRQEAINRDIVLLEHIIEDENFDEAAVNDAVAKKVNFIISNEHSSNSDDYQNKKIMLSR
jgi:hypothetical protein